MSILIVDDHPRIAVLMQYMLTATTYGETPVVGVTSIEKAEAFLSENAAALVFLDNYIPPHRNFRTSLDILRPLTDAPVILLSGSDLVDMGLEDLPDGLAAYLQKDTISPSVLQNLIDTVLQGVKPVSAEQLKPGPDDH